MSATRTEITLIRHGETDWNAQRRIQGHLDIPLNPTGLAQAATLGKVISPESIDVLYASDLERAYRTAWHIVPHRPSVIQREPRLRERHLGVLQGLSGHDGPVRHPQPWKVFTTRDVDAPLEGGEALRDFQCRVTDLLLEMCARHAGQRITLVTHGGVLDVVYRFVRALPLTAPRDFPIHNASINVLSHQEGRWQIDRWGDVSHLTSRDRG